MQTTQETDSTPAPAAQPLFSTGKKIVFIGALLVWGGFFLPWFSDFTIWGKTAAGSPGGAEIPYCLGWIPLAMAFLAVILPDAFPGLGPRLQKLISLCALALGAAVLVFLLSNNPGAIEPGLLCTIAGYALLLPGVLLDFAKPAAPEP